MSNSKKPTKLFKYILHKLIRIISIYITIVAFNKIYSNNFKIFVSLVISTLSLNYLHNNHMKTPTKVDSQKNIIKLPLSTFKSYVKKIVKMIEPLLSVMSLSLKIFTVFTLIDTFFELSKEYNKSHEEMVIYFKSLFSSYNYDEVTKISYNTFLKENKERIIKLCFPNINMDNPDEVNKIVRENNFILHNIGRILYRERELLKKVKLNFKLPDEIVKIV